VIKEFTIKNYRCFDELVAPLGPLTVLIGENNTGKSCFLQAIARSLTVGANAKRPSSQPKISLSERYRMNLENKVSFQVNLSSGNVFLFDEDKPPESRHSRVIQTDGVTSDSPNKIESEFSPINFFEVPKLKLGMSSQGITSKQKIADVLKDDGEQIAGLIDYLLRNDRKRFDEIERTLMELIPGVEGLHVGTPKIEERQLEMVVENGLQIKASQASVGVKLMIFFVTLAYHPVPPKTLLIEEPETGVHPKRLADIMKLLRSMSKGEHGIHPVQVIMSTHSPYLLDCVDLNHDTVLVFERESSGRRACRPVDEKSLRAWTDEFLLGELWMAGDEKGLLGEGIQVEK
jgi:predicted ATPase